MLWGGHKLGMVLAKVPSLKLVRKQAIHLRPELAGYPVSVKLLGQIAANGGELNVGIGPAVRLHEGFHGNAVLMSNGEFGDEIRGRWIHVRAAAADPCRGGLFLSATVAGHLC